MQKRVDSIVFRRLTVAEFNHIYHTGSHYGQGGGQSYIDFPVADVPLKKWFDFLGDKTETGAGNRPKWSFIVHGVGITETKTIKISNRRTSSVSVTSQKILGASANRVPAWHPDNGFPTAYSHNIIVYIIKTTDNEFWAGWFEQATASADWPMDDMLKKMFTEQSADYLKAKTGLFIDTGNKTWPFYFDTVVVSTDIPTEDDKEEELIAEDISPRLDVLIKDHKQPEFVERVLRIRQRNKRLVTGLKGLYAGKCQITGEEFTFIKKGGEYYSEVHHLIPLGENGSDSYDNAIVVSPLLHRMLHYANVSPIDLNNIVDGKLQIVINDKDYEIKWHEDHELIVKKALGL
jgi:5-methylcytosine-specific restriction protein A